MYVYISVCIYTYVCEYIYFFCPLNGLLKWIDLVCVIFHRIAGLTEVIIYSSPDDKKKNRGFCFLEYESHKAASLAKRRLSTGRIKVWSCDIIVDWADPQEEPDEQTMSKVSNYGNICYMNVTIGLSNETFDFRYAYCM